MVENRQASNQENITSSGERLLNVTAPPEAKETILETLKEKHLFIRRILNDYTSENDYQRARTTLKSLIESLDESISLPEEAFEALSVVLILSIDRFDTHTMHTEWLLSYMKVVKMQMSDQEQLNLAILGRIFQVCTLCVSEE